MDGKSIGDLFHHRLACEHQAWTDRTQFIADPGLLSLLRFALGSVSRGLRPRCGFASGALAFLALAGQTLALTGGFGLAPIGLLLGEIALPARFQRHPILLGLSSSGCSRLGCLT